MAATDYQSLVSSVRHDQTAGLLDAADILRMALLKLIANTVAPTVSTDSQSLLSSANVSGYSAAGLATSSKLIELALLQIIAQNVGSGGSGAVITSGAGAPSGTATTGSLYIQTSNNTLWDYNGGWNQLV